ncbi:MAG: Hsp33 family molecular chaperone HslO [Acidobacteriia bacterium]|nr:Hsp33 family molecular chaperone HslO [Terriglobia bacterium]
MTARRRPLRDLALAAFLIALGICSVMLVRSSSAQTAGSGKFPVFEPDNAWPKLPNNWVLGNVSKIAVDKHDNVWLIHRPRTVPADKTPAPPVVELDANGKFVQAWGGEGTGYDWPDAEHNVFVDYKDNVWISGSSPSGQSKTKRSDDMVIKFTNSGKFLMQIGGRTVSQGSTDPKSVNKPGDIFVSQKTNELYVSDGYGNRRLIVFAEQVEAGLKVAVAQVADAQGVRRWRGGSLMIQRLPPEGTALAREAAEDGWRRAVILMSSSTASELVDPALSPETLLFRLFHEDGVRVYRRHDLVARCRCSRARVETVLRMLPPDEVAAMKVDGAAVVTCQFCSATYRFDDADLHALVDS